MSVAVAIIGSFWCRGLWVEPPVCVCIDRQPWDLLAQRNHRVHGEPLRLAGLPASEAAAVVREGPSLPLNTLNTWANNFDDDSSKQCATPRHHKFCPILLISIARDFCRGWRGP